MVFYGRNVLNWGLYLFWDIDSLELVDVSGSELIKHSKYYKNYAIFVV